MLNWRITDDFTNFIFTDILYKGIKARDIEDTVSVKIFT